MKDLYVIAFFLLAVIPFAIIWNKLYKIVKVDIVNSLHYCILILLSFIAFDIYFVVLAVFFNKISSFDFKNVTIHKLGDILISVCFVVNICAGSLIVLMVITTSIIAIIKKLNKMMH